MKVKYIKNSEKLALDENRQLALQIIEAGYQALDTAVLIEKTIHLDGDNLHIGPKTYQVSNYDNIYVIGFGKLSCQAAGTTEKILGPLIKKGVVIGMADNLCQIIETHTGTHPVAGGANIEATKKIINLGENATEKDLVITIVSGGGSALLCDSQTEAKQSQKLYQSFLKSGGTIFELNTVRKHLSRLKGGGLAKLLYPAEVVSLIFCDVPGDGYDFVASGPTYQDKSTKADAEMIINKYDLGDFILNETPKEDKYFTKVTNLPIVSSKIALEAMAKAGQQLSLSTKITSDDLTTSPEAVIAHLKKESTSADLILAGGEISLSVPESTTGLGGRCSTLSLMALNEIADNQLFVAFASDGYDNTPSAGAIADHHTKQKSKEKKLNPEAFLKNFDSYNFFKLTDDLIETDKIESNVSDLMFLLTIPKK